MNPLYALVLAWAVERAQMIISAPNYGSIFNGLGCVDQVNMRITKAPMAYRVLVPWTMWLVEKIFGRTFRRVTVYQTLKVLLDSGALYFVGYVFGPFIATLTAVFLLLTFKFDYWDWSVELMAVMMVLTGQPLFMFIAAVLLGLSRETVFILPVVAVLTFGIMSIKFDIAIGIMTLLCAVAFFSVRIVVGRREMYCSRYMLPRNWKELKESFKFYPFFHSEPLISLILFLTVIPLLFNHVEGWFIPFIIFPLGWVFGIASETRIFATAIPWVAIVVKLVLVGGKFG